MKLGNLISDFMKRLAEGDRVVLILSEKYLRSRFCVTELYEVYDLCGREKVKFLGRVIPLILADVRIDDILDRVAHAKYWKEVFHKIKDSLEYLGTEDFARFRAIERWYASIGDILVFVADQLTPRGFDAIAAHDFQAVRELLERK